MSRPDLQPTNRPITAAEYHRLYESGALGDGRRIELLAGEIHQAAPIGGPHAQCVRRLTEIFFDRFRGRATISVQNPIALSNLSEPQPDLALLERRSDAYPEHPRPEEVLLVVEVAVTSYRLDREVKLPLYAAARIPEVWLVDLPGRAIEIWRSPRGNRFREERRALPGEAVSPMRFPGEEVAVDEIVGGEVRPRGAGP